MIPVWASERIGREVDAYLARGGSPQDPDLARVAAALRAWPVYGDLGGVLLLATDGTVYCWCDNTLEVQPESDPRWQSLARAAAAEVAPELR